MSVSVRAQLESVIQFSGQNGEVVKLNQVFRSLGLFLFRCQTRVIAKYLIRVMSAAMKLVIVRSVVGFLPLKIVGQRMSAFVVQ